MAKISRYKYKEDGEIVTIFCPACQRRHSINHTPGGWGFNGDVDKPTFEGSIGFHGEDSGGVYCHSLVANGRITFLSDSGHAFAGQTIELPELPSPKTENVMFSPLHELREFFRDLRRQEREICERIHRHHRHIAHESRFTFLINNFKFSAMNSILSVPSGTPVSGYNAPLDANNNQLPDSAYKAGSCVYGVIAGPSGNLPGFTVAPGATEEQFVVTETTPGSASDGIITFDAQDVNGNQLPQSQGTLAFTVVPPPPPVVAVGSQFVFNTSSTSATVAAASN